MRWSRTVLLIIGLLFALVLLVPGMALAADELEVFAGQDKMARVNEPVQFNDARIIKPNQLDPTRTYTFSWDFDDRKDSNLDMIMDNDAQSNEQFTQWTFRSLGVYTVTLTVEDGFNVAKDTLQVSIVNNKPPDILANATERALVNVPHTLHAQATDDTHQSHQLFWDWDFGDEVTSEDRPPISHTYSNTGSYYVKIVVTDPEGAWASHTIILNVLNPPSNDLEVFAGHDKVVRVGVPLEFIDADIVKPDPLNTSRTYTFSWDLDDGKDSDLDGIYFNDNESTERFTAWTFMVAGEYVATVTLHDGHGWAHDTLQVSVRPNEPPVIHANDTEDAVVGSPHVFHAEANDDADPSTELAWQWHFGDGATSDRSPPVEHTYSSVGLFTVTIVVTDTDDASSSFTMTVNVSLPPSDDLEVFAGRDKAVRVDVLLEFGDSAIIKPDPLNPERAYTFSWDFDQKRDGDLDGVFDNDAESTEQFTQWTYHTPGIYVVTLTVDDGFYSAMSTLMVAVRANQPPQILANDTETEIVTFDHVFHAQATDDYSPAHLLRWHWDFGDGMTSENQPPVTHAFVVPGVYDVKIRVTDPDNDFSDHTITITVTVPSVDIDVNLMEGDVLKGTVEISGSVYSPVAFDGVVARVDQGDWTEAVGVDDWTYQLDTEDLSFGDHTFQVVAYLKSYQTEPESIEFSVNQPPEISIVTSNETEVRTKDFVVSGTSADDGLNIQVQYRIDGGEWVNATGGADWSIEVDVDALEPGVHALEVRTHDGLQYSETRFFTFEVGEGKEEPGFGAITVLVVFTLVCAIILVRRMSVNKA